VEIRQELSVQSSTKLKAFFGDLKLIVLDEAQKIEDIGTILKLIVDVF